MDERGTPADRSVRVAAWALVVVGLANAALGVVGLVAAREEVAAGVAVGLVGAGAATAGAGWLVHRGSRATLYVALAVFEALLVVRLLTLSGGGGEAGLSLVVLLVLVGALLVATVTVRRGDRRRASQASRGGPSTSSP